MQNNNFLSSNPMHPATLQRTHTARQSQTARSTSHDRHCERNFYETYSLAYTLNLLAGLCGAGRVEDDEDELRQSQNHCERKHNCKDKACLVSIFATLNPAKNLLFTSGSLNDGLVYGKIRLKRYPSHTVRAFADTCDFDMKPWRDPSNLGRNIQTIIGEKVAGQGTGYEINIYGSKKLTPIFPWTK
jgi:hypothetical protein